jgi:hypothetical protein
MINHFRLTSLRSAGQPGPPHKFHEPGLAGAGLTAHIAEPKRADPHLGRFEAAAAGETDVISLDRRFAALSLAVPAFGAVLLLAGCGGVVEGRMLHTPETFKGETTASIDGDGAMSLKSNRGARCSGPYRQVPDDQAGEVGADERESGVATLTCNDGRTGSVMFLVGADQAVGTGMLGRDIVTLRIAQ